MWSMVIAVAKKGSQRFALAAMHSEIEFLIGFFLFW